MWADILHAHREADPGLFQAKALSKFLITTSFLRVTNTGFSKKARKVKNVSDNESKALADCNKFGVNLLLGNS